MPLSVRAQLLATEHWSLLASRSTTQSEVLTRINMFLTLVSAGLVSLALVGQATRFSDDFFVFAIAVLAIVVLVGTLTQIRVLNVSMEDLMYVLAMNRLRSAYLEIDKGLAPYIMSSPHDDEAGMARTYYFLGGADRGISQPLGSSMVFIIAVNGTLVGLLAGTIANRSGSLMPLVFVIGAIVGIAYVALSVWRGGRRYFTFWRSYDPQFPSAKS